MGLVSPSQSNPGDTIEAADINGPVNQLASVINGNIDNNNLADSGVTASKVADGAITASKVAASAITLGYAALTSTQSTASTTAVLVAGLTTTVTIPAGSRKIKITAFAEAIYNTLASYNYLSIWDGTVGSGTQLARASFYQPSATAASTAITCFAVVTPSAGSKTYSVGFNTSAGVISVEAAATYPSFILVEAI